jgi:hypothetical protein
MLPIELPILFNTDETATLNKAGVGYLYKDCDIKDVCFFNISYIIKIIDDDGLEYSKIGVNGDSFIVNMNYKALIEYIKIYNTNLN